VLEIKVFASWRDVRRQTRAVRRGTRFHGGLKFGEKRLMMVAVSMFNLVGGVLEEGLLKMLEKYLKLRRRT
jgi:hypothetical protein